MSEQQLKNKREPLNNKKVLIIKENAELLEYQDFQTFESLEHELEPIPNLVEGITLKRHQNEGLAWFQSLYKKNGSGCLLADDMGLGKTIQALSFIQWIGSLEKVNSLIVAPVSLIENWEEEYNKFFSTIPYRIINDRNDLDLIKKLPEEINKGLNGLLCIIGYGTLRSNQLSLCAIDWNTVILDEAQNIKTPGRIVTNAAKALKAKFKIAMTGTPIENSFHDIWSIMDFCVPGLLGSAKEFGKKYKVNKTDSSDDVEAKGEDIRSSIDLFFKRRLKSEIAHELPVKYESNVDNSKKKFNHLKLERKMPAIQLREYERSMKSSDGEDSQNSILKTIGDLKRISDHPYLNTPLFEEATLKEIIDTSARTLVLMDILNDIKGKDEKVIIFAEFRSTQRMIANIVTNNFHIYPSIINGSTKAQSSNRGKTGSYSRQQLINNFNDSPGFNVIVMSPIAAGVGLTVTGANHVVHYSRHWNPAKEDQATDRAYRIGQNKDVFVYYPKGITKKFRTFDLILDDLLNRKRNLSKATLYPSEMAEIKTKDLLNELKG